MQRISTERLLTVGLALYADRRTMEQRVRGIFGRKSTAGFARALTIALVLVIFAGCFTTACMPVREEMAATGTGVASLTDAAVAGASTPTPPASVPINDAGMARPLFADAEEAPFAPVDTSLRIVREAADVGVNRTLVFDADVEAPDVTGYSITPITLSALTLNDNQAYMQYLAPDADWQLFSGTDGARIGDFPAALQPDAEDFYVKAENPDGGEYRFGGHINENGLPANCGMYFSRFDGVTWEEDLLRFGDENNDLQYFTGAWPIAEDAARAVAEKTLIDLNITNLVFEYADRAIGDPRSDDPSETVSRGWLFGYALDDNGLAALCGKCSGLFGNDGDIAYTLPIWCSLRIYVDERGVGMFDYRMPCESAEPTVTNVSILPPEEICDRLSERISRIYRNDANAARIAPMTFTVKKLRLAAATVGKPYAQSDGGGLVEDNATEGLLVPVWEAITETSYAADGVETYSHTDIYRFCAIDGAGIVGRQE